MSRYSPDTGDELLDAALSLTPNERAFADAVLAGNHPRDAVRIAYPGSTADSGQRAIASRKMAQPELQAYMRLCLERVGLTTPNMAERALDILDNATVMQLDRNGGEHLHTDYRVKADMWAKVMAATGTVGPRDRDGAGGVTVNIHLPSLPGVDAADLPQIIDVTPTDLPPSP